MLKDRVFVFFFFILSFENIRGKDLYFLFVSEMD